MVPLRDREAMREWLRTEEALDMAMAAAEDTLSPRRWWRRRRPVLEQEWVVVPHAGATENLFLVGATEKSLSDRERQLVDSGPFWWALWCPVSRTLSAGDGPGVVLPPGMSLQDGVFCLVAACGVHREE